MAPDDPQGGRGRLDLAHPILGSLSISGRDLMLAVVLLALGVGAVAVQWISLSAFQSALARDVVKIFAEVERAQADREHILAVLRAQTCIEAVTIPRRDPAAPKERER